MPNTEAKKTYNKLWQSENREWFKTYRKDNKKHCIYCNVEIGEQHLSRHQRTQKHQRNILKPNESITNNKL